MNDLSRKINPICQQASLPGPSQAPVLSQKRTGDRASAVGDLCGALSVGVDLSRLPSHTHQLRYRHCHIDSSSDAESWEDSKAAQSSSVSTPILSASLLHARSILSDAHAEAPTHFFTCNCSWAREHVSLENNYEMVIQCFRGETLPFDLCLARCPAQPGASHTASLWVWHPTCLEELRRELGAGRLGPGAISQPRHLFCCSNRNARVLQMCPGDTFIIDTGENLNSCHALKLSRRQNCGSRFM